MAEDDGNRRASPRHSSSSVVWVAPIDSTGQPAWTEVKACRCHDLSRGGVSIYADAPPRSDEQMVMLGTKETGWTYMRAKVVYCQTTATGESFLVGCKFLGRLELQGSAAPE